MDPLKGVFQGYDIISSGLKAEMQRAKISAINLSNMNSVGNESDPPYRRRGVIFEEAFTNQITSLKDVDGAAKLAAGVKVKEVFVDHKTPFRAFRDENHPKANKDGYVLMSNVDMFRELVELSVIERSYQANLAAMRVYQGMLERTVNQITK